MYLKRLELKNYRCFEHVDLAFHYPGGPGAERRLSNLNLLLGINGGGKTTILRAIALGLLPDLMPRLGPAEMRYYVRHSGELPVSDAVEIKLELKLNKNDQLTDPMIQTVSIYPGKGEVKKENQELDQQLESILFQDEKPSFLLFGYGATRWAPVASQNEMPSVRNKRIHPRYQRVASLFEDQFGLMPLEAWLHSLFFSNPQKASKLMAFIQYLMPDTLSQQSFMNDPILFKDPLGTMLPINEFSDGYRSFLAWLLDLVYHFGKVCPDHLDFKELEGVVMVDEIDLHLHPQWQQRILQQISEKLPKIQFILTSHSPLIAGTLPADQIFLMSLDEKGQPAIIHPDREIRGLDADQVLLTPAFGLTNSRTPDFRDRAQSLYKLASSGDRNAALELLSLHAQGLKEK